MAHRKRTGTCHPPEALEKASDRSKSHTKQKGKPDVEMPAEVVEKTKARYTEVFERLTDNSLEDALKKLEN